jgi:hypothetical protein
MKEHQIRRVLIAFAFGIMSMIGVNAFAQTLDEVLGVRTATSVDGKKSQMKIDELTDQTRDLLSQFKQVMKIVDGLRVYNEQQERLIRNQEAEMAELNQSIDNVSLVERQITPLIERMITNLEKYIELDMPFLMTERQDRIAFLIDTLDRADVAVSEKFSQVMQAYQVENTYGSSIDVYTDVIELNGKPRQVDVLKMGRVSLVFQSPDGEISGAWDNDARRWVILEDKYRSGIRDGMRMARKTQTVGLVQLPVAAPGE